MSAREYRDAYREYERVTEVVRVMKDELAFKILELKSDISAAEAELEDDRKNVQKMGQKLKAPFFTKVDGDMVFRMANNQPVQIIPFTEE
jgi:hypothetical protein